VTPESEAERLELLARLERERYAVPIRDDRPLPGAGPRRPYDDGVLAGRRRLRELALELELEQPARVDYCPCGLGELHELCVAGRRYRAAT
jgi:hypothetical protein